MGVAVQEYSRSQVKRAGKLWARALRAVSDAEPDSVEAATQALRDFDRDHDMGLMPATEAIDWWRNQHAYPLRLANAGVRYYTGPNVSQRLKRFGTMVDKLRRHPTMSLTTMEDIGGLRAILPDQADAYRAFRRLKRRWEWTRERDYVTEPKDDGYRALHLIVWKRGWPVEIQLRTPNQDQWAQSAESLTRVLGRGLKFGEQVDVVSDYYRLLGEIYALRDAGQPVDEDRWERNRELYARVVAYLRERGIDIERGGQQ